MKLWVLYWLCYFRSEHVVNKCNNILYAIYEVMGELNLEDEDTI